MRIEFRVPYPVSTNKMFLALRTKTGRAYRVKTQEATAYELFAAGQAKGAMASQSLHKPRIERLRVSLDIYPPKGIGIDIDNIKAVLDSLTGIVYVDDKQIWELHIKRQTPRKGGGVYVVVETIEQEGEE